MIWEKIDLQITPFEVNVLKDLNGKIIKDLENHLPLDVKKLDIMKGAMTTIVNKNEQLVEVLKDINKRGRHYVIRLTHNDNEILNLPWSMATDAVSKMSLANIEFLNIVKYLSGDIIEADDLQTWDDAPPLKILIMLSSPDDLPWEKQLSYDDEEYIILSAFEPLLWSGLVEIDYTTEGSLDALKSKLKDNKYHVVHFSGHGLYKDGEGYLLLEDQFNLKKELVSADAFARALKTNPKHTVPLVLLSACQSAQGQTEKGLVGVTNQLLQHNIPAVIAMGMSILDTYATSFAAKFYSELSLKRNIPQSFTTAVNYIRILEGEELRKSNAPAQPFQWVIPNLYMACNMEDIVNWAKATEKLEYDKTSYRFVTEQKRLLIKHDENYRFIGRRRERQTVMESFIKKLPVLLKGQGGAGKSSLAEYMVQRLIVSTNKEFYPFFFSEKEKSLYNFLTELKNFLFDKGKRCIDSELALKEKGIDKFKLLISELLSNHHQVVLVFDNLETFQVEPGGRFKDKYTDIFELIHYLYTERPVHLVLTCRYPLSGLPNIVTCDLNHVGFNDFWKKCQYLDIGTSMMQDEISELGYKEFVEIVQLLHGAFGGNYRALEFFNELFKKKYAKSVSFLRTLPGFIAKFEKEVEYVKVKISSNLLFDELLSMLDDKQRALLYVLSQYRIPVNILALSIQKIDNDFTSEDVLEENLLYLNDLTLVEISIDRLTNLVYYYTTPIIKELIGKDKIEAMPFLHKRAGAYYYHIFNNIEYGITELEEAFLHFCKVRDTNVKDMIDEIGDMISRYYYDVSMFAKAYYYCFEVYSQLGDYTDNRILNRLGLVLQLFGKIDEALMFYNKAYAGY